MTKAQSVPPERFSRMDIIDEHELVGRQVGGELVIHCSCGYFHTRITKYSLSAYERMQDEFLKHVQQVRDVMRGHIANDPL